MSGLKEVKNLMVIVQHVAMFHVEGNDGFVEFAVLCLHPCLSGSLFSLDFACVNEEVFKGVFDCRDSILGAGLTGCQDVNVAAVGCKGV